MKMPYHIKPLTPDMAERFAAYLDAQSFDHEPNWASCFCRFYHTDCSIEQWIHRTAEQNRSEAIREIGLGNMKGYLAFDGETCIGWCNANDAHGYARLREDILPYARDLRLGLVICFVIHPEYRGRGVARLLLSSAVEGFRSQGYDAVLGLPAHSEGAPQKRYRGTHNMFLEQGFERIEGDDDGAMMLRLNHDTA